MSHPWPLFDLRVRTPRLELRHPDDADLVEMADLAVQGITDGGPTPFAITWNEGPPDEVRLRILQFQWKARAEWTPDNWNLGLVAVVDGEIVGNQGVSAKAFPVAKAVHSGSWIGKRHQGQGLGTEMRAAMLHLAFEGLGADAAFSGAWVDNERSIRVSRRLGYQDDGFELMDRSGQQGRQLRFRLERERWLQHRRDDIVIEGLEPCRALFGLDRPG